MEILLVEVKFELIMLFKKEVQSLFLVYFTLPVFMGEGGDCAKN